MDLKALKTIDLSKENRDLVNEEIIIIEQNFAKLEECDDEIIVIHEIKPALLSKNGAISKLLSIIKDLNGDVKKDYSRTVNELKKSAELAVINKIKSIKAGKLLKQLELEKIDPSIPCKNSVSWSSVHIITKTSAELVKILEKIGFIVYDGPQIDTNDNNFTNLNIPEHHPARQMHDTFYLDDNGKVNQKYVMRTHTSNIQIHAMKNNKPPIRGISFGKVFRYDSDATHSPMFHQIECFCVDEGITMANLKFTIQTMIDEFFETKVNIRLRPSFFPFTEPSGELDISYIKNGNEIKIGQSDDFLEVGGLGMIHDNVLKNCNIDSSKFTGFAFGFGVDRLAMLKYGLNDIRKFYDPEYSFIMQNNIQHHFV